MRVIAGTARGRPLRAPRGQATRPTSDRVREALFSSIGPEVPGSRVLDLFAGSGALGIEALSRGAAAAVFVEHDPRAVRTITGNLVAAGVRDRGRVLRADAARVATDPVAVLGGAGGTVAAGDRFDLVLCDPPYALTLDRVLDLVRGLHAAGALAERALVVIERDRRDPDLGRPLPAWIEHLRDRRYGDTVLRYLRPAVATPPDDAGVSGEEPTA